MNLTILRSYFQKDYQVTPSEGISSGDIDRWLSESIVQHNPAYNPKGYDLPVREYPLVMILAGIRLCEFRAAAWANKNDISSPQSFGQERNTPYAKNMSFKKALEEKYLKQCATLNIVPGGAVAAGAGGLVQGSLVKNDFETGYRTPFFESNAPSSPVLTATLQNNTEAILQWSADSSDNFSAYRVFSYKQTGSDTLYQAWESDGAGGTPKVNTLGTLLKTIYTKEQNALKVVGLTSGVYLFLVVTVSTNLKYGHSNEVSVTVT